MVREYQILITGPMGAGKTTAIRAVSRVPVVGTEGIDYGEVAMGSDAVLRLHGMPGQERHRGMWEVPAKSALGVIVLLDNRRKAPLDDLMIYVENFRPLVEQGAVVVGVGRTDACPVPAIDDYYAFLSEQGLMMPVLGVDVRRREDVLMLFDVLFSMLELSGEKPPPGEGEATR